MSITEGVRLGLDMSRGARQESRADQRHQMALKQAQEDEAYQARMRPLQEQNARLGLRDLEGSISQREELRPLQVESARLGLSEAQSLAQYNEKSRPLQLEAAELGLSEAKNSAEHNKQLRPLQLDAQRETLSGARQNRQQNATVFEQGQEDRGNALRKQWVAEQTPLEYARFERTGSFSDRYLRESMAIGSPVAPLRLVDGAHIEALDTLQDLLDPRRPSNPYDGNKLFEAANLLLAPELNNGGINPHNGAAIVDKRIVAAYPAKGRDGKTMPGKLYVELEMTDEKGEKYRAPATVGRGSGDDDELKTIDLSQLVQRVNAQQMFSKALNQDPAARQRLVQQGQKLTKKDGAPLKDDQVSWQGRPRKFDDVYQLYSEDASLKTPEGQPLVDFEAFEWTQGDNQKLAYLRAAAKENAKIYAEAAPLMRKDPAKAQQLMNEWVDPMELYQMAQQGSGKPGVGGRETAILNSIGANDEAGKSVAAAAREQERAEFLAQPDWHLSASLPSWAAQRMTEAQRNARAQAIDSGAMQDRSRPGRYSQANVNQDRTPRTGRREPMTPEDARERGLAAAQKYKAERQKLADLNSYFKTTLQTLPSAEQRAWVAENYKHFDTDTRRLALQAGLIGGN